VGEYLRSNDIAPDDVYVSSKWGYSYVADWNVQLEAGKPHEVKDHSEENFLKQFEESMNILGEYINLYQIHSATFASGVLENSDVHKALHECKKKNGISIGLSVSSPTQDEIIEKVMTIEFDGGKTLRFGAVYFQRVRATTGSVSLESTRSRNGYYHKGRHGKWPSPEKPNLARVLE